MIFFTADLHLGHDNIIRHCHRPFENADEMDQALIKNWNSTVTSRDDVYILGDFTMRPAAQAHEYLSQLKGRKYFVQGNHDKFLNGFEAYQADLEWVKDYFVLKHEKRRLVLFHYPILEWDQYYRGAIHLYGHIHNNYDSNRRASAITGPAFNVGVDVNGYKPVSVNEIFSRADSLPVENLHE